MYRITVPPQYSSGDYIQPGDWVRVWVPSWGKTGQPELGSFLESPCLDEESAGSRHGPEMRCGKSAQFRLARFPAARFL